MTQRTKEKIEENLTLLCTTLRLDQSSTDEETQSKIRVIYNALQWTAEDVEAQCKAIAKQLLEQDEQDKFELYVTE